MVTVTLDLDPATFFTNEPFTGTVTLTTDKRFLISEIGVDVVGPDDSVNRGNVQVKQALLKAGKTVEVPFSTVVYSQGDYRLAAYVVGYDRSTYWSSYVEFGVTLNAPWSRDHFDCKVPMKLAGGKRHVPGTFDFPLDHTGILE